MLLFLNLTNLLSIQLERQRVQEGALGGEACHFVSHYLLRQLPCRGFLADRAAHLLRLTRLRGLLRVIAVSCCKLLHVVSSRELLCHVVDAHVAICRLVARTHRHLLSLILLAAHTYQLFRLAPLEADLTLTFDHGRAAALFLAFERCDLASLDIDMTAAPRLRLLLIGQRLLLVLL